MKKNRHILARNFSQALFSLDETPKKRSVYATEIESIARTFDSSQNLRAYLACPSTSTDEKQAMLKGAGLSSGMIHFMGLVIDTHALDLLPQISRDYRHRVQEASDHIEGTVYVAEKKDMDKKILTELISTLQHLVPKKISLKVEENKEIVAGFKLSLGDLYLDATLEKTLNNLIKAG